jgi:hypothetical protein
MVETTLPPFATPDTLYALCRSADNRHCPPFQPDDVVEIMNQKKAYFASEADRNPLVREILAGGRIDASDVNKSKHEGFLDGPATFFRTHELLRATRRSHTSITVGAQEYDREAVVQMFDHCVPNARLNHLPWCSVARYGTSVGLALGVTLLAAFLVARDNDNGALLDWSVFFSLGAVLLIVAIACTTFMQKRDLRRPAAWNTCLYLDLNADLLRRDSPGIAAARKEFLPRQGMVKTHRFYYPLARQVEAHAFDAALLLNLPAEAVARRA